MIGIEVNLIADEPIVRETLLRMGIKDEPKKVLYPSAHLFKENDRYYIAHFKEMFDHFYNDRESSFSNTDKLRLNTIVFLLIKWDLVELADEDEQLEILKNKIDTISHQEKEQYTIINKFKFKSINP